MWILHFPEELYIISEWEIFLYTNFVLFFHWQSLFILGNSEIRWIFIKICTSNHISDKCEIRFIIKRCFVDKNAHTGCKTLKRAICVRTEGKSNKAIRNV